MCRTLTEGGKRCAAHTRPRYEAATFGTAEWDRAAAEYAATPSGREALAAAQAQAESSGDVERAVAFAHALTEGDRLASAADAVRDALSAEPTMETRMAAAEEALRAVSDELGYHRLVKRPGRTGDLYGTFVFQQGSESVSVRYSAYAEGLVLHLRAADLSPEGEHSPIVEWERRARWDDPEALSGLTRSVRTVLERRKATPHDDTPTALAPATATEIEHAFDELGRELGYTRVRITDVPDGVSRYVDFLRPKPQKSRRFRYYSTDVGWTARLGGRYPRLAGRAQARQSDTELTVSAAWDQEADSIAALGVIRDLFAALD